jgi:hypothetical protein
MNVVFFVTKIQDGNTKDLTIIFNEVILNYDCSWKCNCHVSQELMVQGVEGGGWGTENK